MNTPFFHRRKLLSWIFSIFVLIPVAKAETVQKNSVPQESLSIAEFNRLIDSFSEEGGFFFSDNLTSNEDSYLTISDKLKQLSVPGGAYVGVGPEQNFTYIAKVRPRIAFIVDIRRQAMIQHLMYKAIFHLASTRADFLALLLSRPIKEKALGVRDPLDDILAYFSEAPPADDKTYAENLSALVKTIQETFKFHLDQEDRASLEFVYRSFRDRGFNVGFDIDGRWSRRFGRLPNLKELLAQKDLSGKQGNFLASAEDYDFVRGMHRRNLIIPVVGDFAGKKALASVGEYLTRRKIPLSVFYASNVEILLFNGSPDSMFSDFANNIKKFPVNDRSLLIRSTFSYYGHPAQIPGYRLCTLMQSIPVFLKDFDSGRYRYYRSLIVTHYIAPDLQ
jgi:hypothetical protein